MADESQIWALGPNMCHQSTIQSTALVSSDSKGLVFLFCTRLVPTSNQWLGKYLKLLGPATYLVPASPEMFLVPWSLMLFLISNMFPETSQLNSQSSPAASGDGVPCANRIHLEDD